MDNRRIGLFDSGLGGLSILLEIEKLLPIESFLFVADQKNVPYGGKSVEQLEVLAGRITDFLVKSDVKMVVVACNTATVYTIDYLRSVFGLPIIGVVPVVKKIAELTKSGKVAVFATPATSKSPYLQELIRKYATGLDVKVVGGTGLEELVEEGKLDDPKIKAKLEEFILPMLTYGVDTLALGCTHYPFLRDQIEKLVGDKMMVIDSGGAVARQVKRVLESNQALSEQKKDDLFYTTGDEVKFAHRAKALLGRKLMQVEKLELK